MALATKLVSLPSRLLPKVMPKLKSVAQRVTIFAHAYDVIVPAADLVLKYVASYTPYVGGYGELYAFCMKDDVDAVMCVWKDPAGVTHIQVSRMAGAELDVYLDATPVKTFPRDSDVGYWGITLT